MLARSRLTSLASGWFGGVGACTACMQKGVYCTKRVYCPMTNSMSAPAVNATARPATSARISSANAGGAWGGTRPLRMDRHALQKVVAFGSSIGTSSRQRAGDT